MVLDDKLFSSIIAGTSYLFLRTKAHWIPSMLLIVSSSSLSIEFVPSLLEMLIAILLAAWTGGSQESSNDGCKSEEAHTQSFQYLFQKSNAPLILGNKIAVQ